MTYFYYICMLKTAINMKKLLSLPPNLVNGNGNVNVNVNVDGNGNGNVNGNVNGNGVYLVRDKNGKVRKVVSRGTR